MLRLLIDEDIDHRILRGLKTRLPECDFLSVRQIGLDGSQDLALLRWAAENARTILTHDLKTMPAYAGQLLHAGESVAGVIVLPQNMPIGRAIEDLELAVACYSQDELRDAIKYLPL